MQVRTVPGSPLSFEVHCGDPAVECHSKIKGGGFISTKEKLLKCVRRVVRTLGMDDESVSGVAREPHLRRRHRRPGIQLPEACLSQGVPDANGLVSRRRPTKRHTKSTQRARASQGRKDAGLVHPTWPTAN